MTSDLEIARWMNVDHSVQVNWKRARMLYPCCNRCLNSNCRMWTVLVQYPYESSEEEREGSGGAEDGGVVVNIEMRTRPSSVYSKKPPSIAPRHHAASTMRIDSSRDGDSSLPSRMLSYTECEVRGLFPFLRSRALESVDYNDRLSKADIRYFCTQTMRRQISTSSHQSRHPRLFPPC